MPPKSAPPSDGGNPIWWFLAIMIGLYLIWLFGGGPQRYEARHPELTPTTYDSKSPLETNVTSPISGPTVSQ